MNADVLGGYFLRWQSVSRTDLSWKRLSRFCVDELQQWTIIINNTTRYLHLVRYDYALYLVLKILPLQYFNYIRCKCYSALNTRREINHYYIDSLVLVFDFWREKLKINVTVMFKHGRPHDVGATEERQSTKKKKQKCT